MIKKLLLIIGLSLMALNISGIFISLRNPDIYNEFKIDVTLTDIQVKEEIIRREKESDEEYIYRVNDVVYRGVAQYWDKEGINKYHLRVPVWENYILYLASFIRPDIWEKYEFADYNKAIERGVGLCSQHAMIVTGVLNDNGVESQPIGLKGHVVLRAKVKDIRWITVDPYYGVIIPADINVIENNTGILKLYYGNNQLILDIYGKDGNVVYPKGVIGLFSYHPNVKKVYYIEYISYAAIWIIPIMLILPTIVAIFKNRKSFIDGK